MAAVEVLASVASGTCGWPPNRLSTRTAKGVRGHGIGAAEDMNAAARLSNSLRLIADAWVELCRSSPTCRPPRHPKSIIVPDFCSPKWSQTRRLPPASLDDQESPATILTDPTASDSSAQQRCPDSHKCDELPPIQPTQDGTRRSNARDRDLIADPGMEVIDFSSEDGFLQAGGKKKKKQTTTFNWHDDGDKKDGDGAGGGDDGNMGQNGGDSGAGDGSGGNGGDDGDKKDNGQNGDEADNDDIWDFETVGGKKKNKNKGADTTTNDGFGLPQVPTSDFHEIKLDDAGGGGDSLDLSFDNKPEKVATGLGAWTSSWTTGSWGWGGAKSPSAESSKPVEEQSKPAEVADNNPWGMGSGNSKKKTTTTFSFGSFNPADEPKDGSIDFLGTSKSADKNDVVGFSWGAPTTKTDNTFWGSAKSGGGFMQDKEKPIASEEASDDIWDFDSTKKKKKNKIAVIDEAPITQEPAPDANFEFQDAESPKDIANRAAEAALVAEEEAELRKLQTKNDIGRKLTQKQQARYRVLTENAKARADAAAAATVPTAEDPLLVDSGDVDAAPADEAASPIFDEFGGGGDGGDPDSAQAEADERARIAQEEEEEMFILRSKKKPKKHEKDRLKILEENAEQRAREAEEAAAAKEAEQATAEVIDSAEAPADDMTVDADDAVQAELDEKARIIQEEEEELAQLRAKKKQKKPDKDRIQILEKRADDRAREAEEAAAAALDQSLHDGSGDTAGSKTEETAPTSLDDFLGDEGSDQAEKDEAARLVEEEEMELEFLLSKGKLKKPEKQRLKELQDNKKWRDQEAADKLAAEAPQDSGADAADPLPAEDVPADAPVDDNGGGDAPNSEEDDLAAKMIEEEELELKLLLAKSKPKKPDKARIKVLQENKKQREREAAAHADIAADPTAEEPLPEEAAPTQEESVDEATLQKEAEDALIADEESELSELLARPKLKKAEKARLKELQDRKDTRDKEARAAAAKIEEEERAAQEKAEQEARDLEEQQKREEEEKRAVEIEAEEAEISSLKSKKKLRNSEKDRLAELEQRREERASAEASKMAEEFLNTDAADDADQQNDTQPLSWADDDPAANNGAGDDWLDWGTSSSKKSKKKDKSSNLIDLVGADPPAAPEPPPDVPEVTDFDFGWGKQSSKAAETPADNIWSFGGSSKKKSKNVTTEVVEDTFIASPMDETKDEAANNDFWSTFGSKGDQAADPPTTSTDTAGGDGGNVWGSLSGSTELSKSKSKPSKEPKLSKKELEKLEKEKKRAEKEQKAREEQEAKELEKLEKAKKKAEKEQKAREEQEAKELAEKARIEEEERLAAEAKAEEERLAQEEADRIQREEEEKQAALDAIAQEEADLAALQAKKDAGKKLSRKDKDRFDLLSASCQARADEKAAQEAAEQAAREEAERLQREAEEQALKEAIEKEEADLKELQKKKDSGRKLLKKDKDRYELLSANKKARRQAEKEAEAAQAEPAPADDVKPEDDLDKDLANLNDNELDELDKFLSEPAPVVPTATKKEEVDPFSFWGASKKSTSSKKGKTAVAVAEPLLEATISASGGATARDDGDGAAVAWPAWKDTFSSTRPEAVVEPGWNDGPSLPTPSSPAPGPMKKESLVHRGKIADRLKAFEAVPPPPPPAPADLIPPPPPPAPAAPVEEVKIKRKSKNIGEIPGSFPTEDEEHPDDIIEVIDMSPPKSKKSSKKSSKSKSEDAPIPIPPPPPAVPDAPIPPPPEVVKKESKKERPKINRDGGSSWGMWTASTSRDKDKKSPSKSKPAEQPRERKSRSPEKEEKLSSKGSSSDKAESADKKAKTKDTPVRPKVTSVFASTPPISRSMPTREKRHKEGRSSRRSSIDVDSGLISPSPEEMPEMNSKAAKILGIGGGVGLGRSSSKRKKSTRPAEDDDIVMVGANDVESSPEKPSRRRPSKSYPQDDDIVMVDVADAVPTPGLRRSNTTGSTRKGFGGLFGGILGAPRSEPRKRSAYHTDGEDAGAATDADAHARKAARRAQRVEREVAEKTKDEARREKRRRREEEAEAKRQAEKEARRAERRAARTREERHRRVDEADAAREERRRQKRAEREAAETGAEDADAEARRAAKRERRKARAGGDGGEDEEERRRRHAEKRAAREAAGKPTPTRRRTEPVEDDFVYPRPTKLSRRHTDGMGKSSRKPAAPDPPSWPHSGTSSWVKDHIDAGPPPDDAGMTTEAPEEEMLGDEDMARRERRRRRRYGDVDAEMVGDRERRRKRREERSEGSDERRGLKKGSLFADVGPAVRSSSGGGGIGGFWKKLTGS